MEITIYKTYAKIAEAKWWDRKTKKSWVVPARNDDGKKLGYIDLHEILWLPASKNRE